MVKIGKIVNDKKIGRTNNIKEPYETSILCYGLSEKELQEISKKCVKNLDFNLIETNDIVDCAAIISDLVIINTDALDKDDIQFIKELEEALEGAILIGKKNKTLKKSKLYKNVKELIPKLKYEILTRKKNKKKRAEFSAQVYHVLSVLKLILNKPYITTQEIARELEISTRTVIRNIETLRMFPENIKYDKSKKGWYIEKNFSFLLSDIKNDIKVV